MSRRVRSNTETRYANANSGASIARRSNGRMPTCAELEEERNRYCGYGSVSRRQLVGCLERVTDDEIARRNTNAAAYARRELETCLQEGRPTTLDWYCERYREEFEPSGVQR